MKKFLLTALLVTALASTSFAFPELQLYIDGATYDAGSQTWVASGQNIDLYVIANMDLDDVLVSIALDQNEYTSSMNPDGIASATFDGSTVINDWTWGDAPLATVDPDPNNLKDLAGHGVYPSWYAEFNAGNFRVADGGGIGDVEPINGTYFDPSAGYLDPANTNQLGQFKKFSVSLAGAMSFHFDAYTLNEDGSIQYFAPFSHDAGTTTTHTPEPATMLLFGLGLAGAGVYRRFKK